MPWQQQDTHGLKHSTQKQQQRIHHPKFIRVVGQRQC